MSLDYELENDELHVSYVDGDLQGKKQLTITEKGVSGSVQHFADGDITQSESIFGDSVTVTLKITIDGGSRLFTLFLPKLAGGVPRAKPVSTVALLTTNAGPVAAPNLRSRSYQAMTLSGVVAAIDT